MPEPSKVYNAIDTFLGMKGYRPDCSPEKIDGHRIRSWIDIFRMSGCGSEYKSASSDEYIRRLLGHMANVPDWDCEHHESALKAGGYAPDFVPWPKKLAGP